MAPVNPLHDWLAEDAANPVSVRIEDTTAESRENLRCFGLNPEQRDAVTVAEAVDFVRAVAAARGRWLAEHGAAPMRFYCWHDAQAGQLRFSLVSCSDAELPFRCSVEQVTELSTVVKAFLSDANTTGPLHVWVVIVP